MLKPLPVSHNRTETLISRLTSEITSGRFGPGDRLPTEQQIATATGVSRTVVREAVAALKGLGLVETKQGVGAFVARRPRQRPFELDPARLRFLPEVLDLLELRISIEVEAAGLAAERHDRAQLGAIRTELSAIEMAITCGEDAVEPDLAFHFAIADATNNPHFRKILGFLGSQIIPRRLLHLNERDPHNRKKYLLASQAEHKSIFEAIRLRDVQRARRAMRRHLQRGRERYRKAGEALGHRMDSRSGSSPQ
ncbi:MAG: FadR/GntR family transcriptional regulator [Betaproteobacteria bacterium]